MKISVVVFLGLFTITSAFGLETGKPLVPAPDGDPSAGHCEVKKIEAS